jgi:hypothetical protein
MVPDIREDCTMPAIVEFPTVVKEVLDEFAPFFANEPERRHFAESCRMGFLVRI